MKFRPRPDRPSSPSKGRRISTIIVAIALISIFCISPDPPSLDQVHSFSTSVLNSSTTSLQTQTHPEPLPEELVPEKQPTPQQIAEDAEREARKEMREHHGPFDAETVQIDTGNQHTQPAEQMQTTNGDAEHQLNSDPPPDPATREADYVKNEITEDRTEQTQPVQRQHPVEDKKFEQNPAPQPLEGGAPATERQEPPKPEVPSESRGGLREATEMDRQEQSQPGEQNAALVNAAPGKAAPERVEREAEGRANPSLVTPVKPAAPVDASKSSCLRHIVYDKPVKTGSTAVTKALKDYLDRRGEKYIDCTFEKCTTAAKQLCAGNGEKMNMVEHMLGDEDAVNCLGRMGYYKVTSIREPLERWESSFLYNRGKKTSHYGISWKASYEEFMSKYPACSLYDYYDGLGKRCEMAPMSLEERIRRIVERYDEVIDLYHDDGYGQLHRRLLDDLKQENKSSRPSHDFRVPIDSTRLQNETRLYDALKQRQKEMINKEPQLC